MPKQPPMDQDYEDGSWFLEAVGVKKAAPSSIESIAELTKENTLVDTPVVSPDVPPVVDTLEKPIDEPAEKANNVVIEMTSFDGDPGTSLSTFDPVPELPPLPANIAIAIPSRRQPQQEVPSMPTDEPMDEPALAPVPRERRPIRWPVVAVVFAILAILVIAFVWLPRAADSAASTTRQNYYDASSEVRTFLPTAQASLDVVTTPTSTDAALGTVIPVVSELSTYATSLATAAAEPLPTTLPFVASDAIDELPPLQDRSAILAAETSEVARQIGHAYVYRTSIPELLAVDNLPTTATTAEFNALSVTLASSLAEDASLIADLPSNPAFDDLAQSASDAVAEYAQWQQDYLTALAGGDDAAAETLINSLTAMRLDLLSETQQALLTFREAMDGRMVSLSSEFDDHLADLSL